MRYAKIFLLILLQTSTAFAIEPILWENVIIPYDYNLKKDLKHYRKCNDNIILDVSDHNPQMNINKLRSGDLINLPICSSNKKKYISKKEEPSISGNSSDIIEWKSINTPSGFVLSQELVYNKYCSKIWTKQIYEFLKKNPKIKNVNKIPKNVKISLQECQKELKETIIDNSSDKVIISKAINGLNYLTKENDHYFEIYGGLAHLKNENTYFAGVANRANLIGNHGYNLKMLYIGNESLLMNATVELKTNNLQHQLYAGLGIGNHIQLSKQGESTSFLSLNLGTLIRPSPQFVFESYIGTNIGKKIDPNFYISGMSYNGKYWKGLFLEYKQLTNPFDAMQNKIVLAGFKLSF